MSSRFEYANDLIKAIDDDLVQFETHSRHYTHRMIVTWIAQMGDPVNMLRLMAWSLGMMPDTNRADRITFVVRLSIIGRSNFDMEAAVAGSRWVNGLRASAAA